MPTKRSASSSLDSLREQIDRIDAQILRLINRRARLAQRIGQAKQQNKAVAYVPSRERQIMARLSELNPGPLSDSAVQAIYREIISASRALEQLPRIAYVGPAASYTHIAAREQFGAQAEFVPAATIPQVFTEVEQGRAHYGVVPIENSDEGAVGVTLDMFVESPLQIIAERCVEMQLGQAANVTRFAIVGHEQPSKPTGHDKTLLLLSVRDQAGGLHNLLQPFADNAINLLRIESRPLRSKLWEYLFFIDVEGHVSDTRLARALQEIEPVCVQVKILGSYATAKSPTAKSSLKTFRTSENA